MLPNHQPLVIAEQFGTLDALHPGRIDLGIGRAPGTDPRTARALRRGTDPLGADDFPEQLTELVAYFHGDGPVLAVPAAGQEPALWLLGFERLLRPGRGSAGSARSPSPTTSAARTRLPALALYRQTFRPSAVLAAAVRDDLRRRAGRRDRRRGQAARAAVGPAVPAAAARYARTGAHAGGGRRLPVLRPGAGVHRAPDGGADHRVARRRCATACGSWSSARGSTS